MGSKIAEHDEGKRRVNRPDEDEDRTRAPGRLVDRIRRSLDRGLGEDPERTPTESGPPDPYRFEGFELRRDSWELFFDGERRKLQQQPARLLGLLLERPGVALTREEIHEAIWGEDRYFEVDANINFAVRQIRIALGDDASEPRFVETVPRVGYRFIGRLDATRPGIPEPPRSPTRRATALFTGGALLAGALGLLLGSMVVGGSSGEPPVVRVDSIHAAVADDGAGFEDGVREQLVSSLVRSAAGRATILAHPDGESSAAGRAFTVSGAVDLDPPAVRVDLRLATADGTSIWADEYVGRPEGLRKWLGTSAWALLGSLPANVEPVSPEPEPLLLSDEATTRYFLSLYRTRSPADTSAEEYFRGVDDLERLVADHPSFVDGRAALARAYVVGAGRLADRDPFVRAGRLASAVLEASPTHPEALLIRARTTLETTWDLRSTRADLERASRLVPGDARVRRLFAAVLAPEGGVDAALDAARAARRLDPADLLVQADVAFFAMLAREPRVALAESEILIELDPRMGLAHSIRLWALGELRGRTAVLEEANRFLNAHGADSVTALELYVESTLGFLSSLRDSGTTLYLDLAEALLRSGRSEDALRILQEGCRSRGDLAILFAAVDPRLDPLRDLPGFPALLHCLEDHGV